MKNVDTKDRLTTANAVPGGQNGIGGIEFTLPEESLRVLAHSYTREAGVRNLEREISGVCRKIARRVAEGELAGPVTVRPEDLGELLGPVRFEPEIAERAGQPGVAVGLAWTPAGGDILFVESTRMPGKGELKLTGSLGDVMRESAEAAQLLDSSSSPAGPAAAAAVEVFDPVEIGSYRLPSKRRRRRRCRFRIRSGGDRRAPRSGPR